MPTLSPRLRLALVGSTAAALAIAGGFMVFARIPPRAARLLPEADAIVYVDLEPIRLATHLDQKPVPHSADYQHFIDATGIVFERDLDSAAFALHKMPQPDGPNGPVAYSEVFRGRFDDQRLTKYLASIAVAREQYAGHQIFSIPVGLPARAAERVDPTSRVLRVAELDTSTIVASNAPTTEQIHVMLDRARSAGNPFSGSTLLSGLYSEVPTFASVWGIGAIGLPFAEDGHVAVLGFHLPLADTTPFVASLRYTTALHLRIEQIAADPAAARRSVQTISRMLILLRQVQQLRPLGDDDAPASEAADSLRIQQHGDRAVLTAVIPLDLVRKLASPGQEN